jgi:transposase-like protein
VKATARKLAEFQERCLEEHDLVALFLDGKSFADEQIIIALGVTLDGQKIPLGFVQAATENERACRGFLADLVARGLRYEAGLLVVIDGAKELYQAVLSVFTGHACVQRCHITSVRTSSRMCPRVSSPAFVARWRRPMENRPMRGQGGAGGAQTGLETDEPVRPP